METFSALLALCAGNSSVTGEFPTQRPVMRSFDLFFDLRLNKRLSKQSWGWWYETLWRSLWRHCDGLDKSCHKEMAWSRAEVMYWQLDIDLCIVIHGLVVLRYVVLVLTNPVIRVPLFFVATTHAMWNRKFDRSLLHQRTDSKAWTVWLVLEI